jgi:hypothetical protein
MQKEKKRIIQDHEVVTGKTYLKESQFDKQCESAQWSKHLQRASKRRIRQVLKDKNYTFLSFGNSSIV